MGELSVTLDRMWALNVASRLRSMRRLRKLGQEHVARFLEISVSEISRLERGVRGLRVEQLGPWARSLGSRAEVVFWDPISRMELEEEQHLDEEALRILSEVAAVLPYLPPPARRALSQQMQAWREHVVVDRDEPEGGDA